MMNWAADDAAAAANKVQSEQAYDINNEQNRATIEAQELTVKLAEINLEKYLSGDFKQQLQDLDGNVIMGNVVGRNGINGGPHQGPGDILPNITHTAGIEVFSPLIRIHGTVIAGNHITGNYYGIWTRLVPALQRSANTYSRVRVPVFQLFKPL